MKHLTMELGGKSPNIIFADADIDAAVQVAFWGIFWNKGEVCVAGSRLLVERACYDEVVEKLGRMAQAAILGDPLDPATQIGPIASRAEYDKVLRYIDAGKGSARLVAGGGARKIKIKGKGLFIEATVFFSAPVSAAVVSSHSTLTPWACSRRRRSRQRLMAIRKT